MVEAARIGAHEYLLKPVSTKALLDRIIAIIGGPRPTVKLDGYYGPLPRRLVVMEDPKAARPTDCCELAGLGASEMKLAG